MEFFADFKPTSTISINPPGGTGHPHPHHPHVPPSTEFPTPIPKFLHATHAGHTALWVIFVIFTLGLIAVGFMSLRVEKKSRVFHWISIGVLTTAMLSYLVMATGMGTAFVPIHNHGAKGSVVHLFREVYYARYIDWLITTPLLLLSLALLAGLSPADTVLVIFFDVFMVVTGLLGGLVNARYSTGERARWFYFAISCVAFLGIWWVLISGGAKAAKQRSKKTRGLYFLLSAMTIVLWTAYPIVFALTEGSNKVGVDAEIIAYGILDVAAKVGFTFLLLGIHTHGDEDSWILPDWFVDSRAGSGLAREGRGNYGAIRSDE